MPLTQATFDTFVEGNEYVIVDFVSARVGPLPLQAKSLGQGREFTGRRYELGTREESVGCVACQRAYSAQPLRDVRRSSWAV